MQLLHDIFNVVYPICLAYWTAKKLKLVSSNYIFNARRKEQPHNKEVFEHYIPPLVKFSGNLCDWSTWKISARIFFRMIGLLNVIDDEDYANANPVENSLVSYHLILAVLDGNASSCVLGKEFESNGFASWKKLEEDYDHYEARRIWRLLEELRLDDGYEFIDKFQSYVEGLRIVQDDTPERTLIGIFMGKIESPYYSYVYDKLLCTEDRTLKDCYYHLYKRSNDLNITRDTMSDGQIRLPDINYIKLSKKKKNMLNKYNRTIRCEERQKKRKYEFYIASHAESPRKKSQKIYSLKKIECIRNKLNNIS